jgi:hypothetical protein
MTGLAADADGRAYITGLASPNTTYIASSSIQISGVNGYIGADNANLGAYGYVAAFNTTLTGTSSLVYWSAIPGLSLGFQHLAGNGCGSVVASGYNDNATLTNYPLVNPLAGSRAATAADIETLTSVFNTKLNGIGSLTFSSFLPPLPQVDGITFGTSGNIAIDGHIISENGEPVLDQFTATSNAYQTVQANLGGGGGARLNPVFEVISQAIPSGCLNFAPTNLSFGSQATGSSSATQPIVLTNTSDSALTITSITPSAGFTQNNTCGSSLAVGSSCTINVGFSPTVAGAQTGTLTFVNSDIGSPQTISLSGTGTSPTAPVARQCRHEMVKYATLAL